MNEDKIAAYVGFAAKAGKAVYGLDRITKTPGIRIMVTDGSLSPGSAKKLENHGKRKGIRTVRCGKEALAGILKDRNCGAVGITDASLAEAIADNA